MVNHIDAAATSERRDTLLIVRGLVRFILGLALIGAMLFVPAGTINWPWGWVFLAVWPVILLINFSVLSKRNPEVIAERLNSRVKYLPWDRVIVSFVAIAWLAILLVAGFDYRLNWSSELPMYLRVVAVGTVVLGDLIFLWAMSVNKFFSHKARIQSERGHRVVTDGPYRIVRHPGYVGWILMSLSCVLILGSLWGLIPAAGSIAGMVARTVREDKMLRMELEGYESYAAKVRYRLLPGIW
jgi:protein-S-isoprenylcysteine O-methyltransferase Ste14